MMSCETLCADAGSDCVICPDYSLAHGKRTDAVDYQSGLQNNLNVKESALKSLKTATQQIISEVYRSDLFSSLSAK